MHIERTAPFQAWTAAATAAQQNRVEVSGGSYADQINPDFIVGTPVAQAPYLADAVDPPEVDLQIGNDLEIQAGNPERGAHRLQANNAVLVCVTTMLGGLVGGISGFIGASIADSRNVDEAQGASVGVAGGMCLGLCLAICAGQIARVRAAGH